MRFVLYILLVMELVVGVVGLPVQELVSELRLLQAGRIKIPNPLSSLESRALALDFDIR